MIKKEELKKLTIFSGINFCEKTKSINEYTCNLKDRVIKKTNDLSMYSLEKLLGKDCIEYIKKSLTYVTDLEYEYSKEDYIELENTIKKVLYIAHKNNAEEIRDFTKKESNVLYYMITLLASFALAEKEDILIHIDELNLAPSTELRLSKLFVELVRRNVYLIIETYSGILINRLRYEVNCDMLRCNDVVINYKEKRDAEFTKIYLNEFGHFVDEKKNRICFPAGFFDISVDLVLSLL